MEHDGHIIFYHFLPFYRRNNPENQNFEKMRKKPWRSYKREVCDVKFLRYEARQTKFFIILGHCLPFHTTDNPKNQKFKKMKKKTKILEISLFYTSVPKIMIIYYTVSQIWRVRVHFELHIGHLPPLMVQRFKFSKK